MSYMTGFILAVPTAAQADYVRHATAAWPMMHRLGATRMVECWGADVPHGTRTDFYRATLARDDETPLFSWIEWPDRATADAAGAKLAAGAEPEMAAMGPLPFDGTRMMWGGFEPVFTTGAARKGSYVQGFVLAVPADRKADYIAMARDAAQMFADFGATQQTECWAADVTRGTTTDFYRATDAQQGEDVVFSWIEWPDRATCDAAAAKMQAQMSDQPMPAMPFDGKRMFWGGFVPIVDLP